MRGEAARRGAPAESFGKRFRAVVTLRDYNTRVVAAGTTMLGVCGGLVGAFMLLRKRSLVGDVVGHASLPGIAIAFLVMEAANPGEGKWLPGLLLGALLAGAAGVGATVAIRRLTRIKEDAALAIVLGIFFGVGIALFTVVQSVPSGAAAGLNQFIFGTAAALNAGDVKLIALGSAVVLLLCLALFKEFALLCFDEDFAGALGWPALTLDVVLMGLVVGVAVIGLQSVGLLLVVAILVIPAASARFWTDNWRTMAVVSGVLGGVGSLAGVMASALFPRLAAGAVITLAGSAMFLVSLLGGTRRGLLGRLAARRSVARSVGRQHVLRAMYECLEPRLSENGAPSGAKLTEAAVSFDRLLDHRSWDAPRLRKRLAATAGEGLVAPAENGAWRLTSRGAEEAQRVVRNHRLWEMYLIRYAAIAPSHVDRDADLIEHVLEPEIIDELERLLAQRRPEQPVPPSPHEIVA